MYRAQITNALGTKFGSDVAKPLSAIEELQVQLNTRAKLARTGRKEWVSLAQACAAIGEKGAAVFCCEELERRFRFSFTKNGVTRKQMFDESDTRVLESCIAALKPLVAPKWKSYHGGALHGPWDAVQHCNTIKNPCKMLGRCILRLSEVHALQVAAKTAAKASKRTDRPELAAGVLKRLADQVLHQIGDEVAVKCTKRGELLEVVIEICQKADIKLTHGMANDIVGELIQAGHLKLKSGCIVWEKLPSSLKEASDSSTPSSMTIQLSAYDLKFLKKLVRIKTPKRKRNENRNRKRRQVERTRQKQNKKQRLVEAST